MPYRVFTRLALKLIVRSFSSKALYDWHAHRRSNERGHSWSRRVLRQKIQNNPNTIRKIHSFFKINLQTLVAHSWHCDYDRSDWNNMDGPGELVILNPQDFHHSCVWARCRAQWFSAPSDVTNCSKFRRSKQGRLVMPCIIQFQAKDLHIWKRVF